MQEESPRGETEEKKGKRFADRGGGRLKGARKKGATTDSIRGAQKNATKEGEGDNCRKVLRPEGVSI